VAGKSTLPVLSNILLATNDGRLKLAATNLEIGTTCWIGAKIEEDGGLPNDKISLQLDLRTQTVAIKCAQGHRSRQIPGHPDSFGCPALHVVSVALLYETFG
jgi:hypothetical protein